MSGLSRFAIWAGVVVGTIALLHGVDALPGIALSSSFVRDTVFAIAIVGLCGLAMFDDRPLADFGLTIEARWVRRLMITFILGAFALALYLGVLVGLGALGPKEELDWGRAARLPLTLLLALLLGYVQALLFAGFLLGAIRDAVGPIVSVAVASITFALLHHAGQPTLMWADHRESLIGHMLVMAIVCEVRLLTGSVLGAGGVYAGVLFVDQLNRDIGFARRGLDAELLSRVAPDRDIFHGQATWLIMLGIIVLLAMALFVRGERRPEDRPMPLSLKRSYPFGVMNSLAPFDLWIGRLRDRSGPIERAYWLRLACTLTASAFNTLLAFPERVAAPFILARRRVRDPLFIVGVQRSGTTHLQNLLALDPRLRTARTFQVLNPCGFLTTGWLVLPLVALVQPWRRPMDRMKFNILTPNEEEFAIANMTRLSPYWGITFPKDWPRYDRFIRISEADEAERTRWASVYRLFVAKLTVLSRKRALLKNPYNTARIAAIRRVFPRAQFVHIVRNPFDVYRSNARLEEQGHVLMQVQDPDPNQSYMTRFLENYRMMEESCSREAQALGDRSYVRIRFEDLERDALSEIRRIYGELGLELSTRFEKRLRAYLTRAASYRKSAARPLSPEVQQQIAGAMAPFLAEWGYAERPNHDG